MLQSLFILDNSLLRSTLNMNISAIITKMICYQIKKEAIVQRFNIYRYRLRALIQMQFKTVTYCIPLIRVVCLIIYKYSISICNISICNKCNFHSNDFKRNFLCLHYTILHCIHFY